MPAVVRLAEKQDVAFAKDILQGISPPPADRIIRLYVQRLHRVGGRN